MKCKNCGLPRDAHIAVAGPHGVTIWQCPNGSGDAYPATVDLKVELHYRAGDDLPWIARWVYPTGVDAEAAAAQPTAALDLAGRRIEKTLEEKTAEEQEIEKAIEET
jgi:hypothetical protein